MKKLKNKYGIHRYCFGLLGVLVLCFMFLMPSAWAGEPVTQTSGSKEQRVFDLAELFSQQEIAEFESTIATYREEMKMDLVVVTTEDAEGKSTSAYADDFYDYGNFGRGNGRDGVLFLIDMDHRELTLSTSGDTIRLLTDDRIEKILDDVYQGAADGDYVDSVNSFLKDIAYYHKKGIPSDQYNYDVETGRISVHKSIRWYEALLALAVSGIVAGGTCMGVISQYGMKKERKQAANYLQSYRGECKFVYQNQGDNLVNKFVTTRIIPKNTTKTGGGSSGRSSSGRSSTHRSSSGRSHGGGSRKF